MQAHGLRCDSISQLTVTASSTSDQAITPLDFETSKLPTFQSAEVGSEKGEEGVGADDAHLWLFMGRRGGKGRADTSRGEEEEEAA